MGDRPGACPQRGRVRRTWISARAIGVVTLSAGLALAATHDDAAKKLIQKAMYEDYAETNFADAEKKLEQAIDLCKGKADDCTPAVRARALLDLGVIEFVLQRPDKGRTYLASAVQEDPKIALEADFMTPDLVKEFAAVKGAGPATPAEPEGSAVPAPAEAPAEEGAPPPPPKAPVNPECPPNFPGCNATAATCTSNEDCSEGLKCVAGACSAGEPTEEDEGSKAYRKNWFTLAFQENFLLLPSASDVCRGGAGYTCFDANTNNYYGGSPGVSTANGGDDSINGGPVPATMEILAGYDRFLTKNLALGVRLGFILGQGPPRPGAAASLPVHAEGRAAWWFGKNPIARKGFRFYLMLASGMAEVDGSLQIDVHPTAGRGITYENAWTKMGTGFVAFGPGLMYAITPATGVVLEVKAMEMFPTGFPATAFGLQLGYTYGL